MAGICGIIWEGTVHGAVSGTVGGGQKSMRRAGWGEDVKAPLIQYNILRFLLYRET